MRQRSVRQASLLFLTTLMMLLTSLPAQIAAPNRVAAQSMADDAVALDAPSDSAQTAARQEDEIVEEEIIYVGDDDRIYVLDTHQIDGSPLVKWVSPDNDWRSVDVGDFNNDGDMEIVAVGGGMDNGKMAVWDPVVRTGESGLPTINDIPWKTLHQRTIPGRPTLVKAGNFDPNLPGDEILYGFIMQDGVKQDEDDEFRTTIIKSSSPTPDGTNWTDHIAGKDDGNEWTYVESGDLGDGGADEVALLDDETGEVNIFRLSDGFRRIFRESSSNRPYRAVAFGNYYAGEPQEIIITRNTKFPNPTLFYYQFFPGEEVEIRYADNNFEIIDPYPRFVFMTDVNNSGDDEIFMLRRDNEPRLISRNPGGDFMPPLEAALDGDDGYRVGAGGDLDGDGNSEVIILRDDRLRIYKNEGSRWAIQEVVVDAQTNVLRTGDLDGGGSPSGPEFVFSSETISQALEPDTSVQNREYTLSNGGNDDVISFSYQIPGAPSWVSIRTDSFQASEASPARVFASFNAAGLKFGTYTAELVFVDIAPGTTTNSPFSVPIVLTVEEAQITPNPDEAFLNVHPCTEAIEPLSMDITIGGTAGIIYSAAIVDQPMLENARAILGADITAADIAADGTLTFEGRTGNRATVALPAPAEIAASAVASVTWPSGVSWASASSRTAKIPDTLTINVDANARDADRQQAILVLVGDERAGNSPTNVRLVPLNMLCANGRAYLPTMLR